MDNLLKAMERAEAMLIKHACELLKWDYPRRSLGTLIEVAIEEHRSRHYESGEERERPSCLGSYESRESAAFDRVVRNLRAIGWEPSDYAALIHRIFFAAEIVSQRAT